MRLRPYQSASIDELWQWFLTHPQEDPILEASVGAGKSLMIAEIARRVDAEAPGARVLVLVHQKELLQQNLDKLLRVWPQADVGVCSAAMGRKSMLRQITYATIGSIWKHAARLGRIDVVLCDEAHLINPKDIGTWRSFIKDLRRYCPHARVIGFTGTPFRGNGAWLTADKDALFSAIATRVTMRQLLDLGFLAPLRSVQPTTRIDTADVKVSGGDYVVSELAKAADKAELIEATCDEIVQIGAGRRRWLVFAVTVEHAGHVANALAKRGVAAAMVHGGTPKAERDELISSFRKGYIKCLVNVAVLCLDEKTEILTSEGWVGIDGISKASEIAAWSPDAGTITFARPSCVVKRMRRRDEEMVSLNGNGLNFRVTENHTMAVAHPNHGWKSAQAHQIVGKRRCLPASGVAEPFEVSPEPERDATTSGYASRVRSLSYVYRKSGLAAHEAKEKAQTAIALRDGMRYKTPGELTNDECRLIGFWLGDGSLSGGRCVISQSMRYEGIVGWLDGVLASTGINHSRLIRLRSGNLSNDVVLWSLSRGTGFGPQKVFGYYSIEPYLNKAGSKLYWGLSVEQFGCLLEGLWYADGNHAQRKYLSKGGTKVVGTQSALYSLLQAIGSCRGYKMIINGPIPARKHNHSDQWSLSWRHASRQYMGWARPEIEPADPKANERVWCVTSPTGYIVTRRGGVVTITGNTTGFDAPEVDAIFMLRATKSPVLYVQIAGRGMRCVGANVEESIRNGKADCLWADFTSTTEELGPVDMIKGREPPKKGKGEAPFRICDNCGNRSHASATICRECGAAFPEPERIKHGAVPNGAAVMGAEVDARRPTYEVTDVVYRVHSKPDDQGRESKSMRVEYMQGLRCAAKQWVLFDHVGYGRMKAESWWMQRISEPGIPCPGSTDEAVEWANAGALIKPHAIQVSLEGKYPEIIYFHWHKDTHDKPNPAAHSDEDRGAIGDAEKDQAVGPAADQGNHNAEKRSGAGS